MQLLRLPFLGHAVTAPYRRMRMPSGSEDVTAQSRPSSWMELLTLLESYFLHL